MARQKNAANPAPQPGFEDRFTRLQEIVQLLEADSLPLDESMALFREGMELSQTCREQLDQAQHEITILTRQGQQPFKPGSPAEFPDSMNPLEDHTV